MKTANIIISGIILILSLILIVFGIILWTRIGDGLSDFQIDIYIVVGLIAVINGLYMISKFIKKIIDIMKEWQ